MGIAPRGTRMEGVFGIPVAEEPEGKGLNSRRGWRWSMVVGERYLHPDEGDAKAAWPRVDDVLAGAREDGDAGNVSLGGH